MNDLYIDTKTNRPVSYQFVKQMIAKGVDPARFVEAYPKDDKNKKGKER